MLSSKENSFTSMESFTASESEFSTLEPPSPTKKGKLQPKASFIIEGKKNPLAPIDGNTLPKNLPSVKDIPSESCMLSNQLSGSFCNAGSSGSIFVFPDAQQEAVIETLKKDSVRKHMPLTPLKQQGRRLGGTRVGSSEGRVANPGLKENNDETGVKPHTPSPQGGFGPKRTSRPAGGMARPHGSTVQFSDKEGGGAPLGRPAGGGSFRSRRGSTAASEGSVNCNVCLDLGDVNVCTEDDGQPDEAERDYFAENMGEEPFNSYRDSNQRYDDDDGQQFEGEGSFMEEVEVKVVPIATSVGYDLTHPEPDSPSAEALNHEDLQFFQAVEKAEENCIPSLDVATYFSPPPQNLNQKEFSPLKEDILGLLGGEEPKGSNNGPPLRQRAQKSSTTSGIFGCSTIGGASEIMDQSCCISSYEQSEIGDDFFHKESTTSDDDYAADSFPDASPLPAAPPAAPTVVVHGAADQGTSSTTAGGCRSVSTTESEAMVQTRRELLGLEIEQLEDNQRVLIVALEDEMWQAMERALGHELSSTLAWELQEEETTKKAILTEQEQEREDQRKKAEVEKAVAKKKKEEEAEAKRREARLQALGKTSGSDRLVETDNLRTARARRYASVSTFENVEDEAQGDQQYISLAATSASKNWISVHTSNFNDYQKFISYVSKGLKLLLRYQTLLETNLTGMKSRFAWSARVAMKEYHILYLEEHARSLLELAAFTYYPEVMRKVKERFIAEAVALEAVQSACLTAPPPPPPPPSRNASSSNMIRGRGYQRGATLIVGLEAGGEIETK